ncbi:hypothetical protein [Chlorobium limicola]|nr:hypothetical protein [Chlorobium limicola]
MNTIRLHSLILLPPVLLVGSLALVNFFLRRSKDRKVPKREILY